MFIEKVITKTIFDPDVFKVGTKVRAKYQCVVDDNYEYWNYDFDGILKYYEEETIYLEDPEDIDYSLLFSKPHPRLHKISLELVKAGFWVLELM